jgi:2-isopropylmalate synthase
MTKIHVYDTTLRDGTQAEGVQLSVAEKIQIAHQLDDMGVSYVEGGWPGSNPRDEEFFEQVKSESFSHTKITAFGSTRRAGTPCEADPSLQALLRAEVPAVTIFGKSSRFQAKEVLKIDPEANLELIADTVEFLKKHVDEVVYDAEHFFDGAAEDEDYAMRCLKAAADAGADFLVLCDTNGGSLPHEVGRLTELVDQRFAAPVGIHAHNDAELGVANSIESVRRGSTMVQGTINGFGERCGNANLISIIPALELKMGYTCLHEGQLKQLTRLSRTFDEITNNQPHSRQAYVGRSAFAHKAGVHVNAVMKNPHSYEHIEPEEVGNRRRVLVSDLSGRSNLAYKAEEYGLDFEGSDANTREVLQKIKELENEGYQFEGAEASLKLLLREARGERPRWFQVLEADVNTILADAIHPHDDPYVRTRAVLRMKFGDDESTTVAHGNGPVDALGRAMGRLICEYYPVVGDVRIVDYRVRIMDSSDGAGAAVRVLIRATDGEDTWGTVGVSTNVIEASWNAMVDSYEHKLLESNVQVLTSSEAAQ